MWDRQNTKERQRKKRKDRKKRENSSKYKGRKNQLVVHGLPDR